VLATVHERALSLCGLDRHVEAEALLARHLDLYEASGDSRAGSLLRLLQGRIAVGLGRFAEAEEACAAARDGFLALGRSYDAILASLELATVYLAAEQRERLERLAVELVAQFRAREVPRETLAALRLLARAAAERRVTRELVERLRRRIEAAHAPADRLRPSLL